MPSLIRFNEIVLFLMLGLCFGLSDTLLAQVIFDPPPIRPTFSATYTKEPIVLDGKLDEDVWLKAEVLDGMQMKRPQQQVAATERTLIRVLWDDKNLYIGSIMYDSKANDEGFTVSEMNRDFQFRDNDLFGIAIDGLMDRRNAAVFQVNPYGAIRDLQSYDDRSFNRDWNALWFARTTRQDSFWVAEIAIPWESLRYEKGTEKIGVIFTRNVRRLLEENTWPAVPRSFTPYRMNYAADLIKIKPPEPNINIQFNPYALGTLSRIEEPDTESVTNQGSEFGGELKWAINSNSVLDLTVNTDFAQADIDQQVVNLARFNVLFPERRQFFLENADLFSVSGTDFIQPFFSRRIGLEGGPGGGAIPIKTGARLVRRGADWNAGAIFISQDGSNDTNSAQFGVLRYSKNLRQQDQIGIMATYRRDDRPDLDFGNASISDPSIPSGGSSGDIHNLSLTVDGLVRLNQQFFIQSFLSMTEDTETGTDFAARASFNVQTNQVEGAVNLNYVGANYNPRVGFLGTDNFINVNPFMELDLRPDYLPKGWRRYNPNLGYELLVDATTQKADQAFLNFRPLGFQMDSDTEFGFTMGWEWQFLQASFSPLGIEIAPGDYVMRRIGIGWSRDNTAILGGEFSAEIGDYYDGEILSINGSVSYLFQPYLRLGFSYEYNDITNLGISETDVSTDLYSFSGRFALNPRFNLSTFYQRNAYSEIDNWNIRMSWEYQPLSFLFIVFNENSFFQQADPLGRRQRVLDQQGIAKITWLKQF